MPLRPTSKRRNARRTLLIGALALGASLLLSGIAAGFGSFTTATTYPADTNPSSVALGDFNRDGHTDVAVSNEIDNGTVSVFINQGTGNGVFSAAVPYSVGSHPYGMVSGEFSGDHKRDLAVVNYNDNNVSLLKSNGDGTFAPATSLPVDTGPFAIAAGDLNRDGRTDLAVANADGNEGGSGSVSVLLGKAGGFRAARSFAAGPSPQAIQIGRFNGDRKADIVVLAESGPVIVYPGNGRGHFGDGLPSFASHLSGGGYALIAGKFNHDRRLDLAVNSCYQEQTVIMLGKRGGRFREGARYTAGYCAYEMALSDLNRDGKPDLLVPDSGNNQVDILRGHGNGKFTPVTSLTVVGGGRPYAVAAGRFNSDRGPDVAAAANNTANMQAFYNLP